MTETQTLVDSMDSEGLMAFLSGLDEVSNAGNGYGKLMECSVQYVDDEAGVKVNAFWNVGEQKWRVTFARRTLEELRASEV